MTSPLRRPLIAGNWKMNLDQKGSEELIRALLAHGELSGGPEVMIAPPFTALALAAHLLQGGPIRLGAQNAHWAEKGAYTGEISAAQLKDIGCSMVILGHSERRRGLGESDAVINRKVKAALAAGLIPVLCIGESEEERETQRTWQVLKTQLSGSLAGFAPAELASLVVAYEPVWAIGTGKTATPAQAQEAHRFARKTLSQLYGENLAQGARLLYGGSVTPENVDALMAEPDVDGALVGGASLKPVSFLRIARYRSPAPR